MTGRAVLSRPTGKIFKGEGVGRRRQTTIVAAYSGKRTETTSPGGVERLTLAP